MDLCLTCRLSLSHGWLNVQHVWRILGTLAATFPLICLEKEKYELLLKSISQVVLS